MSRFTAPRLTSRERILQIPWARFFREPCCCDIHYNWKPKPRRLKGQCVRSWPMGLGLVTSPDQANHRLVPKRWVNLWPVESAGHQRLAKDFVIRSKYELWIAVMRNNCASSGGGDCVRSARISKALYVR